MSNNDWLFNFEVAANPREVVCEVGDGVIFVSNGIGTGPRIGFQSGPHRERGVTPLVSPAERVGVAQPG